MTYPASPTRLNSATPGGTQAERAFDQAKTRPNQTMADRLPRRTLAQKLRRRVHR